MKMNHEATHIVQTGTQFNMGRSCHTPVMGPMTSVNPVNKAVMTKAALSHPAVFWISWIAWTSDSRKMMVYGFLSSVDMIAMGLKKYPFV